MPRKRSNVKHHHWKYVPEEYKHKKERISRFIILLLLGSTIIPATIYSIAQCFLDK